MSAHLKYLPFAHLNLRFNPFGELRAADRARLAVVDLEQLPEQLQQPGTAIQFVADHGRGKSTHLLALHACFAHAPYTQIHASDKPHFDRATIQFVDSIENLNRWQRWRLYRRSRSIALTTHTDLTKELKTAGYRVIPWTVKQTDPERLMAFFTRRIHFAQRDHHQPVPGLKPDTIEQLIQDHGDDIRAMEGDLYERFQELQEIIHV